MNALEGIMAILSSKSNKTGANKLALLLVLIDIAPRSPESGRVTFDEVSRELLRLHWNHALEIPWGEQFIVPRQLRATNKADNIKAVVVARKLRDEALRAHPQGGNIGLTSFEQAVARVQQQQLDDAIRQVRNATVKNPLKFLQVIDDRYAEFLYRLEMQDGSLTLTKEGRECLISYGPTLRSVVEAEYASLVLQIMNGNQSDYERLRGFLFGEERLPLRSKMPEKLRELQSDSCPYTSESLNSEPELDHVLPWSRVHISCLSNLVFTNKRTNSSKSDLLLGSRQIETWTHHIKQNARELSQLADRHNWEFRPARSLKTAIAIYQRVPDQTPLWEGPGDVVELSDRVRARCTNLLEKCADGLPMDL